MGTFEIFLFTSLLVSSIWLIFVVISISNENAKLKERLRNEPESTYNVWLRALSNNLPMILDNQHGKETKGKKCHFDLYSINTEIKSFSASDLIPTEKDVALALQKQQFEAKEKKYVEKIRQLEKILVAEEIQVSVDGQVTNMKADKLKYEKFELNIEKSHLQKEILSQKNRAESFNKYIVCNHDIDDDFEIKGVGYNAKITLEPNVNKKPKKSK